MTSNLCCLYVLCGRLREAVEVGELSIRLGRRALNQPNLLESYASLAEAHMLAGDLGAARECWVQAEQDVERQNRWRAQVVFLTESANLALLEGNVTKAVDFACRAEHLVGRSRCVNPFSRFHTWRVFAAAHAVGFDRALELIHAPRESARERNPLVFFELTAVLSWLERQATGAISAETASALAAFDNVPIHGKRALLTRQGFLLPHGPSTPDSLRRPKGKPTKS
jgi:hypothetical protein